MIVTHDVDEAVRLSERIVMLTNGPAATIDEVLQVPLPPVREKLRRLEMAHYSGYLAAREAALEYLYRKQAPVEKLAA